jgi:hypothetical protein
MVVDLVFFSLGQILESDTAATPKAFARRGHSPQKLGMVFQSVVEPVLLAFEADQDARRLPVPVIRISCDSASRRNLDRSSLTSASAAWRTRRAVVGKPARRFCFRDDREDLDSFARDVIERVGDRGPHGSYGAMPCVSAMWR